MFERKKNKHKIVYNNYQFYENAALTDFIEKQMNVGYFLCDMIGAPINLLKFRALKTNSPKSCGIYHRHLDDEIDAEIENMNTGEGKIICQNNQSIIFEIPSSETALIKTEQLVKKQNTLLGIPIKKSIAVISILLILSLISLILKIFLVENGNLTFNRLNLALYMALIIIFLIYFTGDLHDLIIGKAVCLDDIMYFPSRSKFKNVMFGLGDILRWATFLGSISISIAIVFFVKDGVLTIHVFKMWLIYCSIGYIYKLRVRQSYRSLLLLEVFLATLSFL